MKILIVEDEAAHYKTFLLVLKDLNFSTPVETTWAQTDQEAISRVSEVDFDMVLMDIGLTGSKMNGIELTRNFKKELNKPFLIVMFSISRADTDKEQALEAGADYYLPKAYSYMEMWMDLGEIIGQVQKGIGVKE